MTNAIVTDLPVFCLYDRIKDPIPGLEEFRRHIPPLSVRA
jgi:hypothetical protein